MRSYLTVIALPLLWACPASGPADQPCLAGSRICNGTVVMLCEPTSGNFEPERVCDNGLVCLTGACLPRGFLDAAAPDTRTRPDGTVDEGPDPQPEQQSPDPAPESQPDSGADPGHDLPPDGASDAPGEDLGSGDGAAWGELGSDGGPDLSTDDVTSPELAPDVPTNDVTSQDAGPDLPTDDVTTEDVGPDLPPDIYNPGLLLYANVPQFLITGNFFAVAWHPSGQYALIAGHAGVLAHVDYATKTVTSAGSVPGDATDIAALDDGSGFLVTGSDDDGAGRVWRVSVDGAGSLQVDQTLNVTGDPQSISPHPQDGRHAVVAYGSDFISYAYVWDPLTGLTAPKGFNAAGGVNDVMWGAPALYGGDNLITTHGINNDDSRTWILSSDQVVANNWSASFGNAGCAGWRPGGNYGLVCGYSSNKLYVFNGSWTLGTLPVGTAFHPVGADWKGDGTRAIVVGAVQANTALVFEVRAGPDLSSSYDDGILVNQSIPQFDEAPWFGNSGSQYLEAAAWRPSTNCDEGLIVGWDNGTSFNPTFGLIIHFWDQDDPDCP